MFPLIRRVAAPIVLVFALLIVFGGAAAAQSGSPLPTPAPNGPTPAGPSAGLSADEAPMVQPPGENAPQARAGDKDDGRILANGKKTNGKINPANDYDWYYFYGSWLHPVTIQVTRKGTVLDPVLYLYGPDGSFLTWDDDSGGNRNPLISNYWLGQSGLYSIGIESFGGYTSGNYSVTVTHSGADKDDFKVLTSGKTVSGKISPNSDTDAFFFEGNAGQRVTISMARKGKGFLDSRLYLYDQYGNYLTYDDDGGEGVDALISDFSLPQTGIYYLEAESFAGDSGGNYKLRMDLSKPNLALNKYSTAWSWHGIFSPDQGNDGNLNTRWAGDYGTNWWWVDLGSRMTFNQVKINWEDAYATEYFVGWSDAPNCLGTYNGFNYTTSSIGYKEHNLGKRTARCVAIRMDTALWWATNYSFWEFEVYNLSNRARANGDLISADDILVDLVPEADFGDEQIITLDARSMTD